MAKSLLLVQSNYSNRILMLGLRDNELTDLSCKVCDVIIFNCIYFIILQSFLDVECISGKVV